MGSIDGKCGIVTGAAQGLGRASAVLLGAEGGSVVVADLPAQRDAAEETVALVEQAGGAALFVPVDVAVEEDHAAVVAACVSHFGGLDFAHNNAGIDLQASIEQTTTEQWDMTMAVNLKGVWLGMKHQLPALRARGGGSIVNTSSLAGLKGRKDHAVYSASKHGVIGLTKAAALEGAGDDVRVNCICPAAVRTPMLDAIDGEAMARITSFQAIKRLAEPSEVAETVLWLLSDRSSSVTGAVLVVDLGTTAGFGA